MIFILHRTGCGFINKKQLGELMDTLGIDATAEEVDLMLSEIDIGLFNQYLHTHPNKCHFYFCLAPILIHAYINQHRWQQ